MNMFGVSIIITAGDWGQFLPSFGITFPSGIGLKTEFGIGHGIPMLVITQLKKTDDNWIPEVTIDLIGPILGERGTTFTGQHRVTILGRNTTF